MSNTRRRRPRFNAQREQRLVEVAQGLLRHESYRAIAARLGVSLGTVANDSQEVLQRWRERQAEAADLAFGRELAATYEIERVAWEAWERSSQPKEITTAEQKTALVTDPESGTRSNVPIESKSAIRREERDPNPAFLSHIAWSISERCKLYGLYAPVKQQTDVTVDITQEALEAREVGRMLRERPDLADKLDALQAADQALQAELQAALSEPRDVVVLEVGAGGGTADRRLTSERSRETFNPRVE